MRTMRAVAVSMLRKSGRSVERASSAIVPASSTPVGPAPTMTKVSSADRRPASFSISARSKASRMRAAERRGVFECFEALGVSFPFVVAEIGVPRPCRENERVVGDGSTVVEPDLPGVGVDALDFGENSGHVAPPPHEMTNRPSDFRGRQRGCGSLIEQRLKQMVVAPVDQRDAHRRPGEAGDGRQAAESAADGDDVMASGGIGHCRKLAVVQTGLVRRNDGNVVLRVRPLKADERRRQRALSSERVRT
jgi:hypothetical protein